ISPMELMCSVHGDAISTDDEPASATPSRAVFVSLSVIMGVTTFASLLLNGLVVVASVRYKELRQPLNSALLSLAAADLGMALAGGLPNTITNAVGGLVMGRGGCVTEGFLMSLFGEITGLC
uniref:G-protein coupled receptors family 1 profile domain-containing protein n=1 Tax=Petromyzon marinus TaxID=7757 RepID=S4RGR1_PETMA